MADTLPTIVDYLAITDIDQALDKLESAAAAGEQVRFAPDVAFEVLIELFEQNQHCGSTDVQERERLNGLRAALVES